MGAPVFIQCIHDFAFIIISSDVSQAFFLKFMPDVGIQALIDFSGIGNDSGAAYGRGNFTKEINMMRMIFNIRKFLMQQDMKRGRSFRRSIYLVFNTVAGAVTADIIYKIPHAYIFNDIGKISSAFNWKPTKKQSAVF